MQLRPSTRRWEREPPAQLSSPTQDKYKYKYKKCIRIVNRQVYVWQRSWRSGMIYFWSAIFNQQPFSFTFSCFTSISLHCVVLLWSCLDLLSHQFADVDAQLCRKSATDWEGLAEKAWLPVQRLMGPSWHTQLNVMTHTPLLNLSWLY